MTQQHSEYRLESDQPLADSPRFIKRPPLPLQEKEETGAENLMAWVWPITAWIIILANTLIAFVSIRDMFTSTYSAPTHYFMTIAFCGTIGALAFIHKFILLRNLHGPNN